MYRRLRREIYLNILLNTAIITVVVATLSFYIIANNAFNAFEQNVRRETERGAKHCGLYLDSVTAYSESTAVNALFLEAVTTRNGTNIIRRLDYLCSYSQKIDGATFYFPDGTAYTSSNANGAPEFSRLAGLTDIATFIASSENSCLSFRTEEVAKIYGNSPYPAENGIITAAVKVWQNAALIGYLFSDVQPAALYEKIEKTAYIGNGAKYFEYAGSIQNEGYLNGQTGTFRSKDGRVITSTLPLTDTASLTVLSPTSSCRAEIALIAGVIFSSALLLLLGAHFLASSTASNTVKRLEALTKKISGGIGISISNRL